MYDLSSSRSAPWVTIGFATSATIAVLIAAAVRGPWLDEFATIYLADPTVPLSEVFQTRWLLDPPPPLFHFMARLWTVLGQGLFVRRLINLIPLLVMVAWFAHTWIIAPRHHRFLAVYALLVLSNPFFARYFPEYRSYFFQYSFETVFFGAAYIGFVDKRRTPDWFMLACIPFLICLHQITAIYSSIMIGCLVVVDIWYCRFRRAFYYGALTLACGSLLSTFTWMQFEKPDVLSAVAWIEVRSLGQSLNRVITLAHLDVIASIAVLLLGAQRFRRLWPILERLEMPSESRVRFCLLLAVAVGLSTTVALLINTVVPIMVTRYFSALITAANCVLAVLLQDVVFSKLILFGLFTFGAALLFGTGAVKVIMEQRWNHAAKMVADTAKRCPASRIYVVARFAADRVGYDYYARALNLDLVTLAEGATDISPKGSCPTLVWFAHFESRSSSQADMMRATEQAAGLRLSASQRNHATVTYTNPGVLIEISPP
jgi:hypothetical protein